MWAQVRVRTARKEGKLGLGTVETGPARVLIHSRELGFNSEGDEKRVREGSVLIRVC